MTSGHLVHSLIMQRLSRFRQSEFVTIADCDVCRMNCRVIIFDEIALPKF